MVKFDFLPELPSPNLDDRRFDDLVEECMMRIPRYCPEWTDHNISDPGVTLIELFAWLTDQMLLRFNQVPRKNYIAFLELLGVRLQSPTPALTELTFYLSSDLPEAYTIPNGVEVATVRTETAEAITFSTDSPLIIGKPRLQHVLTAQSVEEIPQTLRERITSLWTRQPDDTWEGSEQPIFSEEPQPGNCFYLVIQSDDKLDGNVLEVVFQGAAATPTGINPNQPPRTLEAWDGETWQPVLIKEQDDKTRGFSFYEIAQEGNNPNQGSEVRLHLPETFPVVAFTSYRGRWLRCVYTQPENDFGYNRPPRITGISVHTIGGTVRASHSTFVQDERLGISDGTPGQTFQLQRSPILERRENEYLIVIPPGGLPQRWQEVRDFADSTPESLHYTINSVTGTVQFGPLIREPGKIKEETKIRSRIQQPKIEDTVIPVSDIEGNHLEHQYGAVPSQGSEIKMMAYRTGGGKQGNVQSHTLQSLKSAVPYVASVINHKPGVNGADAESLEQAVLRAPRILRTRDRAVTPEDFEVLAQAGSQGGFARVRCQPEASRQPGTVGLLVVPQANTEGINRGEGLSPEQLILSRGLEEQVLTYLDERRILGVQVQLEQPQYVGVSVQTEIVLEPAYRNPLAQQEIVQNLKIALYRYLNPIIGGNDGKGWEFGRPVYSSDIIALMQQFPGVRYLGQILLFSIHKQEDTWIRRSAPEPLIDPGDQGLVCSWDDINIRSGHVINVINR